MGIFIVIWEISYLIVSTKSCEIENKIFFFIIAMFFSRMGTMKFFYQKFCFKNPFKSKKDLFSLVPMNAMVAHKVFESARVHSLTSFTLFPFSPWWLNLNHILTTRITSTFTLTFFILHIFESRASIYRLFNLILNKFLRTGGPP